MARRSASPAARDLRRRPFGPRPRAGVPAAASAPLLGPRRATDYSSTIETEAWLDGTAIGREWDRLKVGGQSEKYFNLVRAPLEEPCPTVTAAGGQNPGIASVTHPLVRRKFSIAELRRLCSFPDDFQLTGTYAQQYERLGRSVPPLMMRAVASTIATEILAKC